MPRFHKYNVKYQVLTAANVIVCHFQSLLAHNTLLLASRICLAVLIVVFRDPEKIIYRYQY